MTEPTSVRLDVSRVGPQMIYKVTTLDAAGNELGQVQVDQVPDLHWGPDDRGARAVNHRRPSDDVRDWFMLRASR